MHGDGMLVLHAHKKVSRMGTVTRLLLQLPTTTFIDSQMRPSQLGQVNPIQSPG